jgi:hypothetical protein
MTLSPALILFSLCLTCVSTVLVLCVAKVPDDMAAVFYAMAIDMLCTLSLSMMGISLIQYAIHQYTTYHAYKHSHPPAPMAIFQIEPTNAKVDDFNKEIADAKLEMSNNMKTLLKLEIENVKTLLKIEIEKAEANKRMLDSESKPVSSATSLSNEIIHKCCDEGDSAHSAAVTV